MQHINKAILLVIAVGCLRRITTASMQECPAMTEMKTYDHARDGSVDILLAAFFELTLSPSESCDVKGEVNLASVQELEAVRWTLQKLNDAGYMPDGYRIALRAYDTESSAPVAVKGLRHLFATVDNNYFDLGQYNDTSVLFGILGPTDSLSAHAISVVLNIQANNKHLIQISPSATAPDLTTTQEHKYFYSLATPDTVQARVMMEVVKRRGWNYVALLYSSDLYGHEGARTIIALAPSYQICLATTKAVSSDYNNVANALTMIIEEFYRSEGGAVIVFASQRTADQIIHVSSILDQFQNIEYIFSEAVTLQKSVFLSSDRLKTSLGSLVVTPNHFRIEDFQSHWRQVVRNKSYALELSEYNPWLSEYINKSHVAVDDSTNIYTLSAIKTAYLYASIIKKWLPSISSSSSSSGPKSPLSNDVIGYINKTEIQFNTNVFPYIPQELIENNIAIKFGDHRFPVDADYNIYNVQLSGEDVEMKQVGQYRKGQLEMDMDKIKSYDKNKKEILQTNLVSGVCSNGHVCGQCLESPVDSRWIYVPGDLIVVAAVPLYRGAGAGKCDRKRLEAGFQFAEAVLFAVDKVNTGEGIFSEWFQVSQNKRKKVGVLLLNTCYNSYLAQTSVYSLFNGNDPTLPNSKEISKKVVGVVGATGSSTSIAMASPLTKLNVVQVSYASTSVTLKDRTMYPYFARTCAPDDKQVEVIIRMLKELNWRYLTVIIQDDVYGRTGAAGLMELAETNDIGIAHVYEVCSSGNTDYYKLYDKLRMDSNVKVIMLFTRNSIAEDILVQFESKDRGYSSQFIFIGSESWGNRDFVIQSSGYGLGAITVLQDLPRNTLFNQYVHGLPNMAFSLPRHRWWLNYWERRMDCSWKFSYNRTAQNTCSKSQGFTQTANYSQDPWVPFVINSVYSILSGAHETLKEYCPASFEVCEEYRRNPQTLYQNVIRTRLPIYGTDVIPVFDENGEGKVGYRIYHVVRDKSEEGKLTYELVGRYNSDEGLRLDKEKLSFRGYNGIPTFDNINKGPLDKDRNSGNGSESSSNSEDTNTLEILIAALVPVIVLLITIIVIVICLCKFWRRKSETEQRTQPEYITVLPEYSTAYDEPRQQGSDYDEAPTFQDMDNTAHRAYNMYHVDTGSDSGFEATPNHDDETKT